MYAVAPGAIGADTGRRRDKSSGNDSASQWLLAFNIATSIKIKHRGLNNED